MIDGIGVPGYPPPRPTNWKSIDQTLNIPDYDNNKIYKLGDKVRFKGQVYIMIDGIGAPGYPPPRPTNWKPIDGFSNTQLDECFTFIDYFVLFFCIVFLIYIFIKLNNRKGYI